MSRRRAAEVREVLPDAKFGNQDVTKFINALMLEGKKSIAETAVYEAFDEVSQKLSIDPIEIFETVLKNVEPLMEVRSKRVGGATYQVPTDVRKKRARSLAFRWIITAARARKDKRTIAKKIAAELLDAHGGRGAAVTKRENTHKMAEANKAFSHFNW
jgi:small subunit ribosomal protein S7